MCIKVHYILLIGVIIVIPSSEEGYITETDCLQKQEKTEMTKWPNSFPSQQQLLPFHMLHKNPDFFFFFFYSISTFASPVASGSPCCFWWYSLSAFLNTSISTVSRGSAKNAGETCTGLGSSGGKNTAQPVQFPAVAYRSKGKSLEKAEFSTGCLWTLCEVWLFWPGFLWEYTCDFWKCRQFSRGTGQI